MLKELPADEDEFLSRHGIPKLQAETVRRQMEAKINCPETTSIGRLFDGVSAILGIRETVSYEGQGAILLEAAASDSCQECYPYRVEDSGDQEADDLPRYVFDWRPMLEAILSELQEEKEGVQRLTAAKFMNTLVQMAAEMAGKISQDTGIRKVVLSGGSFQNLYVLERLTRRLKEKGLTAYTHSRVSCNDEGLSLGQLMIARRQLK